MVIHQRFLNRRFKLRSSKKHDEFFSAQGFSRCHVFIRNKLSELRGGFIKLEPTTSGLTYVLKARIHGKDRELKFLPGQSIRGVGFNGKPVEISFTMEGDYLKEVHTPIGRSKKRPDCVYYDVSGDTLIAKAFFYSSDPKEAPIVWERTFTTKDPIQEKQEYRDQFDEMLTHSPL